MRPFHHRDPAYWVPPRERRCHQSRSSPTASISIRQPSDCSLRLFGPEPRGSGYATPCSPRALHGGTFRIGEHEARVEAGRVTLPDGTLAGSAATMDVLVRNVVSWALPRSPKPSAWRPPSPPRSPAPATARAASPPGYDADLVALTARPRGRRDLGQRRVARSAPGSSIADLRLIPPLFAALRNPVTARCSVASY